MATKAEMESSNLTKQPEKPKKRKFNMENVEFVSPLSISNNIGYPICIESESNQIYVV